MRTYEERRYFTHKAICKAKALEKTFGLQQGIVYEKHREKITKQPGRYDKGSITHYVAIGSGLKSRGKNYKYGTRKATRISPNEQRQLDKASIKNFLKYGEE